MLPRVLYSMPATAICWSTYEFFKYIIESHSQEQNQQSTVASTSSSSSSSSAASSLGIQCKKTDPSSVAAKDGTGIFVIPAATAHHVVASEPPATMKPRELPAMSGAGMYGAMQYNTIHSVDSSRQKMHGSGDSRSN